MAMTATDHQQTGRAPSSAEATSPQGALISFAPAVHQVAQLRRLGSAHLALWGLPSLDSTVQLLISEIVTNAIQHGDGGDIMFALWYFESAGEVRIDVRDGSAGRPVVLPADPERESGRGMALVDALATSWTVSSDGTQLQCTVAVGVMN